MFCLFITCPSPFSISKLIYDASEWKLRYDVLSRPGKNLTRNKWSIPGIKGRNENVAKRLGVISEHTVKRVWLHRISQPGASPLKFSTSFIMSVKMPILLSKDVLTNRIPHDLKSFSVWLLLLNGPKCFCTLAGANLAIHREAISL